MVVLIKPQFEAGKPNIGKNGVVKSLKIHENILYDIINFSEKLGFEIIDLDYSPVTGSKACSLIDIHNLVKNAFDKLKTGGKA